MATRQKGLSPLERDLLKTASQRPGGMVWMAPESLDTLSQTYKAMVRLEKLALLERKGKDGLRWRVTKAGKSESSKEPVESSPPARIAKATPLSKGPARAASRDDKSGAPRGAADDGLAPLYTVEPVSSGKTS